MSNPDYRVPGARLILRADAPREQWLAMRMQGIGGSDIAVIAGLARYKNASPYHLWEVKTADEAPHEEDKDIFWYGHKVEPMLAERFTKDTGIATRQCGMYQSRGAEWMLANPDRLTADGGILEIKTTTRFMDNGQAYLRGEIPAAHAAQLIWYMRVTGRHVGHLIALVDRTVVILQLVYDPEYAERLQAVGVEFWRHVEDRTPPPIDPYTADAEEVAARFPADVVDPDSTVEAAFAPIAEDDYVTLVDLKAKQKEIGQQIKEIETRIKAEIGEAEYLTVNGRPLFRWQTVAGQRTFDKAAVLEKIAADRGIEPTKDALKKIETEYTKASAPTRRLTTIKRTAA